MTLDPYATALDQVVGPHRAAEIVRDLARHLAHADGLPEKVALRLTCERAADGDPLLLAAPGQVWELRPDADIDDAPGRRLDLYGRLDGPPRILALVDGASVLDEELDEDEQGMLLSVLDHYRLVAWPRIPDAAPTVPDHGGGDAAR